MAAFRKKQRGSLLLEAVLTISIAMMIVASATFYQVQEFQKDTAKSYGLKIAQYTSAVRAALVADGANIIAGGSPLININRLKNNDGTCPGGTASQPFLACAFSSILFYGVDLSVIGTAISSNGSAPNPTYSGITVFPGATDSSGKARPDLTGLAAQAAEKYDGYDKASNFSGGTIAYQFFMNAGIYTNPATGAAVPVGANTIVAIAVADAGTDMFLRRDGSNNMMGSLNMNTHDIASARNYTGTGNIASDGNLAIGGSSTQSGAVSMGNNMSVAGNMTVAGTSTQNGDVAMSNNLAVAKNMSVSGSSTQSGAVSMGNNMSVAGNMTVAGTSTQNGDVAMSNNLTVAKNMSVSGSSTQAGAVSMGNNLAVAGNATAANVLAGSVNSTGNMTVGANLSVAGSSLLNNVSMTSLTNTGQSDFQGAIRNTSTNNGGQIEFSDGLTSTGNIKGSTLQASTVAIEGGACTSNGVITQDASGMMLSCQAGKWAKAVKSPNSYRFLFTSSQLWTVPSNVTSAFVTMAGGGGSGAGWRISNAYMTGHSGGYVFSHPVSLIPGETMSIVIGKGAIAYQPWNSGVPANYGPPYYIYAAPDGDDGLGGYPGESSKLVSPTAGVLLSCTGGNGGTFYGLDSYSGTKVAGNYDGATVGSGVSNYPTPNRLATGAYSPWFGAGACGSSNYGVGNIGTQSWSMASGTYSGGKTPFGYGAGGDVYISGCFVTATTTGTCIFPQPGRDGVVMIDVLY